MGNVMVEQIISSSSPDPVEYLQVQDEWVVVLDGAAVLDVDGTEVRLEPGDWVLLPAETPHRVLMTEAGTRWLAVHVHVRADSARNPPV
jgi:quercetin dioxygenase-like cupin family protein